MHKSQGYNLAINRKELTKGNMNQGGDITCWVHVKHWVYLIMFLLF